MKRAISNSDDVIDSRDVIARIKDLESELESRHQEEVDDSAQTEEEAEHGDKPIVTQDFETWLDEQAELADDDAQELKALRSLAEEAEGYASDWRYGETLIRDSYFEKYAQQLADDLHGNEMRNASWPFDYIDWERAADALKQDYTEVDFDGVSYWIRS